MCVWEVRDVPCQLLYMEDGDVGRCIFASHVQVVMTLVIQLHIC